MANQEDHTKSVINYLKVVFKHASEVVLQLAAPEVGQDLLPVRRALRAEGGQTVGLRGEHQWYEWQKYIM